MAKQASPRRICLSSVLDRHCIALHVDIGMIVLHACERRGHCCTDVWPCAFWRGEEMEGMELI